MRRCQHLLACLQVQQPKVPLVQSQLNQLASSQLNQKARQYPQRLPCGRCQTQKCRDFRVQYEAQSILQIEQVPDKSHAHGRRRQ